MIKKTLVFIIFLYKKLVSPVLPPSCRFYPSCSDYASGAIEGHGALKGLYLAALRLLKCHPYHPGGYDPVPHRERLNAFEPLKKHDRQSV